MILNIYKPVGCTSFDVVKKVRSIIKDKKVVIINKYFSLEGKINALIEIIKSIKISKKLCTKNDIIILKKIDTIES